jgi:hypothetical protein
LVGVAMISCIRAFLVGFLFSISISLFKRCSSAPFLLMLFFS